MEVAIWLALIGLASLIISGIVAPTVVAMVMRKLSREEKIADAAAAKAIRDEDHERQDRVAREVREVKETAAVATSGINVKLDGITTMVDGAMTAAMRSELDAVVLLLVMTKRLIALSEAAGKEPSKEDAAALISTEAKIAELRAALAEREKQLAIAEDQKRAAIEAAGPLKVRDERTAAATELTAAAAVETAAATKQLAAASVRLADVVEETAKKP